MSLVTFLLETIKTGALFAIAYIMFNIWMEYKNAPPTTTKTEPTKKQSSRAKSKSADWQPIEKKFRAKVYEE